MLSLRILLIFSLLLLLPSPLLSLETLELPVSNKLHASDGGGGDYFGFSISLSGSMALIGAYWHNIGARAEQGAAYLFDCSSLPCIQLDKLTASDGEAGDWFGSSVSLSGSLALVGARLDHIGGEANQGSAYLFNCSSLPCSQIDKLLASDGSEHQVFGFSVFLSGYLALVGAYYGKVGEVFNQGSAYLYNCSSLPCSQLNRLIALDGAYGDLFSNSLSISGSWILIGAFSDDIGVNKDQGSAYLFDCSSLPCTQMDKLTASDGRAHLYFGSSVSLSGSLALIGAFGFNGHQGAAYLFDCASIPCSQVDKLTASDGVPDSFFGISVSLDDTMALVGAHVDDNGNTTNQGSAYFFDCADLSCTQLRKIIASDGAAKEQFGSSVFLSRSNFLVAARQDDVDGNINQGSAYFAGFFP